MSAPQHLIGSRPRSNWGAGSERAEYAVGSVVYVPPDCMAVVEGRAEPGLHRIESCFSIGEDADFYYRLSPTEIVDRRGLRLRTDWARVSDRIHVIPARAVDYTESWILLWEPPSEEPA